MYHSKGHWYEARFHKSQFAIFLQGFMDKMTAAGVTRYIMGNMKYCFHFQNLIYFQILCEAHTDYHTLY